MMSYNLEKHR